MKTEILRVPRAGDDRAAADAAVARAAELLRGGAVVALPTETVYGLAAIPSAEPALRATKERDGGKPFTWAVASRDAAEKLIDLSALGPAKLARRFWPGPLTLIGARKNGGGTLGVRVPGHPVALALLAAVESPLLLTSANRSGATDARNADEVRAALDGRVALILDAGPSQLGQASTVVSFAGARALLHREGFIDRDMVLRTAARTVLFVCTGNTCRSPMAEALLRRLWADRLGITPAQLLEHGGLVTSAGIGALPGLRASEEALELLQERGIDAGTHRSRALTDDLVRAADAIFVMAANHRRVILERHPDVAAKLELLDPDGRDIPDPIGSGIDVYRGCITRIERALARRVARLG